MLKKFIPLFVLLGLLLAPGSVAAAGKSYSADRYDVDLAIQNDGSLLVTETLVFRFVGGPFRYVFRELVLDESDGVADIQASMDGAALPTGKNAGQVEIGGGNPTKVTWHFGPVSDSTHTFVLKYRAQQGRDERLAHAGPRARDEKAVLFHKALMASSSPATWSSPCAAERESRSLAAFFPTAG